MADKRVGMQGSPFDAFYLLRVDNKLGMDRSKGGPQAALTYLLLLIKLIT
jgi:hypothetical protein